MKTVKETHNRSVRVLLIATAVLGGTALVASIAAIPEAAKLLFFGAVLVGVAFWGRKQGEAKG